MAASAHHEAGAAPRLIVAQPGRRVALDQPLVVGRQQGRRNKASTPGKPKNRWHNTQMGNAFVHTILDDHSRVVYTEIHDDETAATAALVLRSAVAWFRRTGP